MFIPMGGHHVKGRIAVLLGALVATASFAVGATAAPNEPSRRAPRSSGSPPATSASRHSWRSSSRPGLVKTLIGKGPFTVFAPTNAAFAALKKNAPETYDAVASDKELLTKVLTYHVLAGKVPSGAAVAAAKKKGRSRPFRARRSSSR